MPVPDPPETSGRGQYANHRHDFIQRASRAEGAAIRKVVVGNTAAVVSAAPAQRRDLLTHQRVLAAVWELAWAAGKVADAAIPELHRPAALRARLRELELQLESGMISESEFDQAEDEILRRLSLGGLAGRDARL